MSDPGAVEITENLLLARIPPIERLAEIVPSGPEAVPVQMPGFSGGGTGSNFSGAGDDRRLIELWLKDKSPRTKNAYAHELERFFDVTGSKPLGATTLADLQDFADLAAELFAPRTQQKMLAAVKSLFSFAEKVGYLPYNVGGAVRVPRAKDDLAERELSEAEVHRLINLEPNRRNSVILLTLYAGGLRREDVCVLKWRDVKDRSDVHEGAGQVTVFGKGNKTGPVILPPAVYRQVLSLRVLGPSGETTGDGGRSFAGLDEPVFRSRKKKTRRGGHLDVSMINRIVSKAAERAQIEGNVSPHWLRHSHATHSERRGAKLSLIQKTLRHASLETTGRYLHANPTESSAMYLGL